MWGAMKSELWRFVLTGVVLPYALIAETLSSELNRFSLTDGLLSSAQLLDVLDILGQPQMDTFSSVADSIEQLNDWDANRVTPTATFPFWQYNIVLSDTESVMMGCPFVPPNGIQKIVTPEGCEIYFALKKDLTTPDPVDDMGFPRWRQFNQIFSLGVAIIVVPDGETLFSTGKDVISIGLGCRMLLDLMTWNLATQDTVSSTAPIAYIQAVMTNPWLLDPAIQFSWSIGIGDSSSSIWTLDSKLDLFGCSKYYPDSAKTLYVFGWMLEN